MDCFYSTQQFQNGMFIQQPNNFANSWLTCSSLPILQQFSFNIPIFQVLLSCILLINPVAPLYSFFWESVCFLPVLCLSLDMDPSTSENRQREKISWCDLFLEHQLLISVSTAHLSVEMGTSGASECWLCWWNLWDGANQAGNPENWNAGTLIFFGLSVSFLFYLLFSFFLFFFPRLETKHWRQVPLNGDDLVVISFGGSLGKEAQGGFLV